jgi:hypothetical protein
MDTLITSEGRRQVASGELRIEFASFTDRQIFYVSGSNDVLEDPTGRIYFEAYSDDNDKIIMETDSQGQLEPFSTDSYRSYGGSFYASGSTQQTGQIDLISQEVIASSTKNFQRQMIIGTRELWKVDKGASFTIVPDSATFYINESTPILSGSVQEIYIDDVESVFQDYRFGNFLNYRFLPPQTRPQPGSLESIDLGSYTQINQESLDTWSEVEELVKDLQNVEINFEETSGENNLVGQIFEQSNNKLEKLSVIDMGAFPVEGKVYPHVLFAGKLYRDGKGCLTFVNLFILVFEQ